MKKVFTSVLLLLLAMTSFSQVRGVVKDESGCPLVGANVIWLGTTYGVSTDETGSFTLNKEDDIIDNIIVTSFVGYINDTTNCAGKQYLEIG